MVLRLFGSRISVSNYVPYPVGRIDWFWFIGPELELRDRVFSPRGCNWLCFIGSVLELRDRVSLRVLTDLVGVGIIIPCISIGFVMSQGYYILCLNILVIIITLYFVWSYIFVMINFMIIKVNYCCFIYGKSVWFPISIHFYCCYWTTKSIGNVRVFVTVIPDY